jgi:hypothetical protein
VGKKRIKFISRPTARDQNNFAIRTTEHFNAQTAAEHFNPQFVVCSKGLSLVVQRLFQSQIIPCTNWSTIRNANRFIHHLPYMLCSLALEESTGVVSFLQPPQNWHHWKNHLDRQHKRLGVIISVAFRTHESFSCEF